MYIIYNRWTQVTITLLIAHIRAKPVCIRKTRLQIQSDSGRYIDQQIETFYETLSGAVKDSDTIT